MAQVTTYNLTIDDTSPQIVYFPSTLTSDSAVPDLQSSWNQYFDGVGLNTFPGEIGLRNESWHVTQMDGANFSIAFTGVGIDLYGLAVQSTFSIVLDSQDVPSSSHVVSRPLNATSDPSTTLLASLSGLSQQDHIVSFTAHTTNADNASDTLGLVIFDRAVVSVSTGVSDAAISTMVISDKDLQFRGSWSFLNDSSLIPEGDHSCHITQAAGDQAQYTFKGSAIEVGGITNASAGLFNVSLTSDSDSSSTIRQEQLSAHSSFLTYTTLFYASSLNANATHILTITNAENRTLALSSMNITVADGGVSVPSPSPSSQVTAVERLSRGAIAGIAVASSLAVLFLLGILALVICYWRRKRHHRCSREVECEAFGKPRSLHRRIESGDIVPISPRWPGQGPRSPQTLLVGNTSPGVVETVRLDEDGESDSGIGHMQEKNGSVSKLDNVTREQVSPTRRPARHRSFPLARWSGWFTSSTVPSSPSSRRKTPSPQTVPIVSPTPHRVFAPPSVLAPAHPRESQDQRDSGLLEVPRTSPFEIDFEKRGELHPSEPTNRPRSLHSGLGAQAMDMLVSFLDFASSGATSLRESTRSRSRRPSTKSTRTQSVNHEQQSQSNQESSGQSQTTSTGMWTLSLSVDPPPRPARESQELVPRTAVDTVASTRHPFSMVSADLQSASPDSPTESLPMSVSDINFRADEERESPVVDRGARFHLPRHPPLPGTPHSYTYTSNIQSPEFARASHMRQMSAPNLGVVEPRRPYIAQTSLGRRLAQVRAQAIESQSSFVRPTSSSSPAIPVTSEHSFTQPSSSRLRSLPLPFIHFRRSSSGS